MDGAPYGYGPERVTVSHHCPTASLHPRPATPSITHPPQVPVRLWRASTTAFGCSRSRKSAFNHFATTHAHTSFSHWQICRHSSFSQFTSTYATAQISTFVICIFSTRCRHLHTTIVETRHRTFNNADDAVMRSLSFDRVMLLHDA